MSALREKIDAHVNRVARRLALDIDQRVVLRTPVDTGRARSNWLVGLGAPRRDTNEKIGPGAPRANEQAGQIGPIGQLSIQAANQVIGSAGNYQDIWISNNLPYILALEEGSSTQAAEGMARIAVAEALRANRGG